MKCQNCGENEANIRFTQIINGIKKQMTLCENCAKELGIEDINFNMPINFSSFLGDVFDMYDNSLIPGLTKSQVLSCNNCNMTYEEFIETGKFGCDNCYEVFKFKLAPLLKNIHGANKHVGRIGKSLEVKNSNVENIEKQDKEKSNIDILEEKLKQEIAEERYEDAAKTRDEIKRIKQDK